MLIGKDLPFVKEYIRAINEAIKAHHPGEALSRLQCCWLSFVIVCLLVTNSLCWMRFERFGLEKYTTAASSWMFRRARIMWSSLLQASILHLVSTYRIRSGVLAIDDTDIARSRNTSKISKVHKIKDKCTGGYLEGQNIVFLLLVSERVTLPVGFEFYEPDPKKTAWVKEEKRLKAQKVAKKYRAPEPVPDENYPSKKDLALRLIKNFAELCTEIRVQAVVADAYYSGLDFMDGAAKLVHCEQVISQIKQDQLIVVNGREMVVSEFFKAYQGGTHTLELRGQEREATYCSGRFVVKAHKKKYTIIALKYGDEEEYRYLIARDMSWRDEDITKAFALRWLVEVFIQDWKSYEGWNQLAKQQDEMGSDRGVILSLLGDHALLLHPEQKATFEQKQSALTVGLLREKVMLESLMAFIEEIVKSDDPKKMFEAYQERLSELFSYGKSIKHMSGVDMTFLENEKIITQQ